MKQFAKQIIAPIARYATRHSARVIMYHRFGTGDSTRSVSVDVLNDQLLYLSRHFKVVPLRDLVFRLRAGNCPEPYTVVVTVDDVYADFGKLAYPVFRSHGIPVTIYVVSEFASGRMWLWWDAIRYILTQASGGTYRVPGPKGPCKVVLSDKASRNEAWRTLAGIGLTLSPVDLDRYVLDLQYHFSLRLPVSPTEDFAAMDWDTLRALDPEIVEIGAHTCTHPILSRCSSERIVMEIAESKKAIEEHLGRKVTAFCYPNGEWADVDERCIFAVRDAGFESAVMACGTMVSKASNLYALERLSASHTLKEFVSDVSGVSHVRRLVTSTAKPPL